MLWEVKMAEENKPKLSEAEIIARKVKLRRIISRVLMVVASILIIVFIVMAFLTKGNIDTQTEFDTQELRSKLKNIIALEIKYNREHGEYAQIKYLSLSKEIPQYNPNIDGNFQYQFDPETGIATGVERDASHDVNGDDDGTDGLTLSVKWEPGETRGSDFFWTDQDKADFERRAAQLE